VMDQVWAHDRPVTARQVGDALAVQRRLAYITVPTMMNRLTTGHAGQPGSHVRRSAASRIGGLIRRKQRRQPPQWRPPRRPPPSAIARPWAVGRVAGAGP
jgi:hypothetical protein